MEHAWTRVAADHFPALAAAVANIVPLALDLYILRLIIFSSCSEVLFFNYWLFVLFFRNFFILLRPLYRLQGLLVLFPVDVVAYDLPQHFQCYSQLPQVTLIPQLFQQIQPQILVVRPE